MKKNSALRTKRDQNKAYGKMIHVATDHSVEEDSESDEESGEAVRIYNSILSKQPRAFMARVEKEAHETVGTKGLVLEFEGQEEEFELITEEEMGILEGIPDETSEHLFAYESISVSSSLDPTLPGPQIFDLKPSNLGGCKPKAQQYLAPVHLILILPVPQITDLGSSNLGI